MNEQDITNQALAVAAAICDEQTKEGECPERAQYCADAIRALKLKTSEGASNADQA